MLCSQKISTAHLEEYIAHLKNQMAFLGKIGMAHLKKITLCRTVLNMSRIINILDSDLAVKQKSLLQEVSLYRCIILSDSIMLM